MFSSAKVRSASLPFLLLILTLAPAGAGDVRLNQDLTALPQGEVMIAVNPADPQHLVAAWIDWDATRGNWVTTFHARSLDGGATWQSAQTTAPGAPLLQARIDPAVAFDGLGNVFAIFATPQDLNHGVWVLRSNDGGLTFAGTAPMDGTYLDKPWIAADPVGNNVYACWTVVGQSSFSVRFARSTDHGVTFSTPVIIAGSGLTSMVAVGPDGEVYVVYMLGSAIAFDVSLDEGVSWLGVDQIVAQPITYSANPTNGGLVNPLIPTLAVDRTNGPYRGRIYVVWTDGRIGDPDIYLAWSSNQGTSWSTPFRVNDDIPGGGTDQVNPNVWVDDAGHVHVSFLDRREDPDNLDLAVYLATSTNGGATFGPNIRISDAALPQGGLRGRANRWLGDYGGGTGAGGMNHIVWADGRYGDLDVFYRQVDDADFDGDGVLNDGNGDGQYANVRCTGGQTTGCDDNCPGTPNPSQGDQDGDRVGDVCDDCPGIFDPKQHDTDRDGDGNPCDPCVAQPGRPAGDPDSDGAVECTDNCPGLSNPSQQDSDSDGLGDACDPCPLESTNDPDSDGLCDAVDNCPLWRNPAQADGDSDGLGNICDNCPSVANSSQIDSDVDGQGDACDCEPVDNNDRSPRMLEHLRPFQSGSTAAFGWQGSGVAGPGSSGKPGSGFDAFSVSRGLLSTLRATGSLGECLVQGVTRGFEDADTPPAGDGYFYVVQGENYDCGLGALGYGTDEVPRANSDPLACMGHPITDVFATSETGVSGIVLGTLSDISTSDNVYQVIVEQAIGDVSQLEHLYNFDLPSGGLVEVHVEGFRTPSIEDELITYEYSTDGTTWTRLTSGIYNTSDIDRDSSNAIPPVSGTMMIRLIDTIRAPSTPETDQISIDKLWIRVIP